MDLLFIDTNIYLSFYNSNKGEFKKLLKSLTELKDQIFITDQIVHEINRNKLSVFKQSLDSLSKQVNISQSSLPEHLDDKITPQISEWNKTRKALELEINSHNELLNQIFHDLLESISASKDRVSEELNLVLKQAVQPDKKTLKRAKLRKLLGNPPGKSQDPIGDELTWEQLLLQVKNTNRLWIISNDNDYYSLYGNECYLNPKLYEDLKSINPNIEVHCFNKLSDGLKSFHQTQPIETLPSSNELDLISVQETPRYEKTFMFGAGVEFEQKKVMRCPACHSEKALLIDSGFLQSKYGGLALEYACSVCGYKFTTDVLYE